MDGCVDCEEMLCRGCGNGVWMLCECDWYDVLCDCAPDHCVQCYENMKRFYVRVHECQMGIRGGYGSCCR